MQNLYEKYHSNRRLQRKVISKSNFTYRNLIGIIDPLLVEGKRVLDIGCGTGTVDFYMASKGCTVCGIDISKNAIKLAKINSKKFNLFKNLKFIVGVFPSIHIKERFDLIICSEVLEHLDDDGRAVKYIHSLLKKDGIVISSSPSVNAPLYKIGLLKDFDTQVGHLRRYSLREYRSLYMNSKFQIIETRKTEGLLRNFLFTNEIAGKLIRFIRFPISEIVSFLDNITLGLFGESQIFLVARKK